LTYRVTDRSSLVAPPQASKEWTDVSMVVFDFTSWLGSDQYLAVASDVLFQTAPQSTNVGVWVPFPGGCCSGTQADVPLPADVNPITLAGLAMLPGGKKVELSLGNGTPGLAYLASFFVAAGPYARRKEVGVIMTCFALRPFTGVVLPPPPPVFVIGGSGPLPVGTSGPININNTTNAPITITLPASPVSGQTLYFKDVAGNAGTYQITILPSVGSMIDNRTEFYMYQNYQAVEMYWTGTGWGVR
jgi:hypothetical protein